MSADPLMHAMHHAMEIDAPATRVFDALTVGAELRCWWTADAYAEPVAGSVAEFGFNDRAVVFQMRLTELDRPRRVAWTCEDGPGEWMGTRVRWDINEADGCCHLRMAHEGWASTDGSYALCNSTWGELMYRLRHYVQGEHPGPLFKK